MPEFNGPAIARDRLRVRLRELREARGLSSAEVADQFLWPPTTVDEVESGTRLLWPIEAEALLGLYEVDPVETEGLLLLVQFARSRQWWTRHGMTDQYQDFVAYEVEADRICVYEPLVVPGLLQTQGYARSVTAAILRRSESDPDVIARAEVRAQRQRSLAGRIDVGDQVEIIAVVDEIVLRRPIGGIDVMREQLSHLLTEAERGHLTLVVMPTALGGHPGLGGIFELLEFRDDPDRSAVFLESAVCDHILRGPQVVELYQTIVDDLVAAGLRGEETRALVSEIRDEMGS
jgi:transcriptional regulator with XRE-family HTH domain